MSICVWRMLIFSVLVVFVFCAHHNSSYREREIYRVQVYVNVCYLVDRHANFI